MDRNQYPMAIVIVNDIDMFTGCVFANKYLTMVV